MLISWFSLEFYFITSDGTLIATGDYMLGNILDTYDKLIEKDISMRAIYVARPKILEEINKKYLTIFAHPTESKLDVVEKIINNTKIHGIEINVKNKYEDIDRLTNIISKHGLLITKGSDNHELNSNLYDNLSFYDMNNVEVEKLCH